MRPGCCLFTPTRVVRSVQVHHMQSSSGRSMMTAAARNTILPTRTVAPSIRPAAASATPSFPCHHSHPFLPQASCFSTTRRPQQFHPPRQGRPPVLGRPPMQGRPPVQRRPPVQPPVIDWRERKAHRLSGIDPLPDKYLGLPANKAIPFRYVRVADGAAHSLPVPEGSTNGLSEPVLTRDLLADLDMLEWTLVMVSLAPALKERLSQIVREEGYGEEEEEEEEDGDYGKNSRVAREVRLLRSRPKVLESAEYAPICRLLDRGTFAAIAAAKVKEARRLKVGTKELELNWSIAAHDLGYKMRQMREFLIKGLRVELLLAKRRQNRPASVAEGEALLRTVRDTAQAAGANELKATGNFPQPVKLVYAGGSPEGAAAAAKAAALSAAGF